MGTRLEKKKRDKELRDQQKKRDAQNAANERLSELKRQQREEQLEEAKALQEAYIKAEIEKDRQRENHLEDQAASVMARMRYYDDQGAGRQAAEELRAIEARANREQDR